MRMESVRYTGQSDILRRTQLDSGQYDGVVAEILRQVRARGDAAIAEYTERFDHVKPETFLVSQEEIQGALERVGEEFVRILERSKERITAYHAMQKRQSMIQQEKDGSMTGLLFRPLARVGVYVPGGKALYPSSVLMNVLPAKRCV